MLAILIIIIFISKQHFGMFISTVGERRWLGPPPQEGPQIGEQQPEVQTF